MKLVTLLDNQAGLQKAVDTAELDGRRAWDFRKLVKAISAELKQFNELKAEYVRKHGKEDRLNPKKNPEAYQQFIDYVQELIDSDVDIKTRPILTLEDLPKVTVPELEHLSNLGLIVLEEEKPEPKPKAEKKK